MVSRKRCKSKVATAEEAAAFATARSSRPMKSLQRKSIHWLSDGAFDNIFWTSTRTFTQNTGQENALPGTGALLDAHAKMKLWR